jgi:hypothetical protein
MLSLLCFDDSYCTQHQTIVADFLWDTQQNDGLRVSFMRAIGAGACRTNANATAERRASGVTRPLFFKVFTKKIAQTK